MTTTRTPLAVLTRSASAAAYADVLRDGRPLKVNSNLTGTPVPDGRAGYLGIGSLPAQYHADLERAVYVVYSYATPIAWRTADGAWIVPEVKYSATTSAQQGKLRAAIALL